MELSKQVVSLELAKKLKELGVKQDSLFYWVERDKQRINQESIEIIDYKPKWHDTSYVYSAINVAELGEFLPTAITTYKRSGKGRTKGKGMWVVYTQGKVGFESVPKIDADTEADARAKMLIYLLENKLINLC